MASLEALVVDGSPGNARLAIKMDIVKPIPPRIPAPAISRHVRSEGNRQRPLPTATAQSKITPTGLPSVNPAIMPTLLGLVRLFSQSALTAMPVLASAKIGRMMKATGLCKNCSSLCEGDASSSALAENGMAKASATPAIVACTPD